ncbi:MAG: hypothetical protein LBV73_09450 [Paraburkholderia sp.]|nr:hypothetical protein [Paraburkholderia sp.]
MPSLAESFAPVIDPTLLTGLETMLCAAGAWLGREHEGETGHETGHEIGRESAGCTGQESEAA